MTVDTSGEPYDGYEPGFFERSITFLVRHWLFWVNLIWGLYAGLPWLAPLLQAWGLPLLGRTIFRLYTPPVCHQQPDLSYHVLGYQVAYCHRDTAIYTAIFLGGLLFGLVRRRCRPLPWWALVLASLPMALDAATQLPRAVLTEWPLRTENHWAVVLTGNIFPRWFYAGDAVGTLNWWLRTVTGAVFGLGLVFTIYPWIETEARRSPSPRARGLVPAGPPPPRETYAETDPRAAPRAAHIHPAAVRADHGPMSLDDRKHRQCGEDDPAGST